MAKNKKKEVTIKGIIIAVLLVVLVLWYFNHLATVLRFSGARRKRPKWKH